MNRYMSLEEAAEYLSGVDTERIREACRTKTLRAAKIGKAWRLRQDRIDEWYDRLCEESECPSTVEKAQKTGTSASGGKSTRAVVRLHDLKP